MKNLYSPNGTRYTEAANNLDQEVQNLLRPVFRKYLELGYSPRDIGHNMLGSVSELELMELLDLRSRVGD